MVVGRHPQLPLAVADDRRHRIALDHQVLLKPTHFVHRRQRRGLVGVPDCDQVRLAAPHCRRAAAQAAWPGTCSTSSPLLPPSTSAIIGTRHQTTGITPME
jgi:hypothetical protein